MKKIIFGIWVMGLVATIQAETYSLVMQPPNGYKIPRVIGASGDLVPLTGYDYFDWFGITHHRTWFKPRISSFPNDSSVNTASKFGAASEAIRQDPLRQATSSDYYIDWNDFENEFNSDIADGIQRLTDLGIESMICNTVFINNGDSLLTGDWVNTFKYWKYWYSMVYYMASNYDVTMYEFKNEPSGRANYDYAIWESHWLVAADAMRKAMADVNEDFGKNLPVYTCGPTAQGPYWDYSLPDTDTHAIGNVSWTKVKYDIYGNYDVNNPWNYGMYDYHRYTSSGSGFGGEIQQTRNNIASAQNDPNSVIPIVITEMNTGTAAYFRGLDKDTEDISHGGSIAQLLQSTAGLGPAGLGDEGGFFAFKLGAAVTWATEEAIGNWSGVWNHFCYVSRRGPQNYGGITRGGANLQMYARSFSGGKAVVPHTVTSGSNDKRRTIAAIDEELGAYRIYGSNLTGLDDTVSIDLSALDVLAGMPVTIQRVDINNTGQITEFVTLDSSRSLSFSAPNNTTFLVTVPKGNGVNGVLTEISPSHDNYQSVLNAGAHGLEQTLKVSLHHSDGTKRRASFMRFEVSPEELAHRVMLKLSGKNSGVDPDEREILHVYAVSGKDWQENIPEYWVSCPGLGRYHINENTMGTADGTGNMVDIEDNYAGYTSGTGKGLGIHGTFLGAISFHSSSYETAGLDVTDYLNSLGDGSSPVDVTFVMVRTVRYNVNEYDNPYYYNKGVYHYDNRLVEIASDEHPDPALRPRLVCWGNDAVAPELGSPVWSSAPQAASAYVIEMTAATVYDPSGVEYYFAETSGNPGGSDSGWQSSPSYTDTGLSPNMQYAYTVTVRDPIGNTSSPSDPALVSTPLDTDEEAPMPNPMTWASAPALDSWATVSMTATTASDSSGGVEYYFAEMTGNPGGSDSGWQSSPSYTDTGLAPGVQYGYTVTARDVSLLQNTTAASSIAYVTTTGPILFSDDFSDGNRDGWYLTHDNGVRTLDASNGYLETVSDDGTAYTYFNAVANFPAADLSENGNKVTLTVDFQVLEALTTSQGMAIGLYSSEGTKITSDVADYGNGADDSGWFVPSESDKWQLRSGVGTGFDFNGNGSKVTGTPDYAAVDGWHTFSLELEKVAAGIQVTQITDMGLGTQQIMSYLDTANSVTSFDEFVITARGKDFAIDNVVVEYYNPNTPVEPTNTYPVWAEGQGLTNGVNAAYWDNPDGDAMNNLMEYALGGNALSNDAAAFLPDYEMMADGGTPYLNYIYRRRIDYAARGLTYTVGSGTNLVEALTNATEEAGSAAIDADFESVTNRVPMDVEDAQFMKLDVTID